MVQMLSSCQGTRAFGAQPAGPATLTRLSGGRRARCMPAMRNRFREAAGPPSRRAATTSSRHLRCTWQVRATCADEGGVQGVRLPALPSSDRELQAEREWLAGILACWLDEEWAPLPEHAALGAAAADAYVRLRAAGVDELTDVLLALSGELAPFDFRETFTNAYEVANKVSELLLMRTGTDVCCISDADRERFERFGGVSAGRAQQPVADTQA